MELLDVSHELSGTLSTLDTAAEELRVQNEELFAARTELEGASALFRDLFDLAPTVYLVTTVETRILHANEEACEFFGVNKNAIAGKPLMCFVALEARPAFRTSVLRARETNTVCSWLTALSSRGRQGQMSCRLRVRSARAFGVQARRALFWTITEDLDEDLV
jgi:PAS domain S-box-containing protein